MIAINIESSISSAGCGLDFDHGRASNNGVIRYLPARCSRSPIETYRYSDIHDLVAADDNIISGSQENNRTVITSAPRIGVRSAGAVVHVKHLEIFYRRIVGR